MQNLIKVTNVTKDFGQGRGVFNLDLKVHPGEIVGFIGPNGAGKTTTMLMLTGFIQPTSGNIEVLGQQINMHNASKLMPRLGVMLTDFGLPAKFKPNEIFANTAGLYGQKLKHNWLDMAKDLDLSTNTKYKDLSLGNKKKIGVINALMHKPELVIMDEPTAGLDPLIQHKFLNYLKKVKKNGGAVLLSSHVLSEVQSVCDRIIMIKQGKVIINSTTDDIMERALKRFRFNHLENKILKQIQNLKDTVQVDVIDDEVVIYTRSRKSVIELLHKNKIYDFYLEKPSLEEMFLEHYGNE